MCEYTHDDYLEEKMIEQISKNTLYKYLCEAARQYEDKSKHILSLAKRLKNLVLVPDESVKRELMLTQEGWKNNYLEYNVNMVHEYIIRTGITPKKIKVNEYYEICSKDDDAYEGMKCNPKLENSKRTNPVIILKSDFFDKPYIINGNHRIRIAKRDKVRKLLAYIISADDVMECLTSDGYREEYHILIELRNLGLIVKLS